MMAERVGQPSLAQPVGLVRDRRNLDGTVRDGHSRDPVRVSDQQVEPHRGAAERLRTEIAGLRCLVGHPEACLAHGQLSDNPAVRIGVPVDLLRVERPLVEGHCLRRPRIVKTAVTAL